MQKDSKRFNLNGWQRLWVLITLLNFFATSGVVYLLIPQEADIGNNWVTPHQEISITTNQDLPSQEAKSNSAPFDPFEVLSKQTDKTLQEEKIRKSKKLREERFNLISAGVMWWVGSSFTFYLIGWGIGWVYRGFKKP